MTACMATSVPTISADRSVGWFDCSALVRRVVLALWLRPGATDEALAAVARMPRAAVRRALGWLGRSGLVCETGPRAHAVWALSPAGAELARPAVEALL